MWTRGRFVEEYIPGLFVVAVDSFVNKRADSQWQNLVTIKESKKKKEEDVIRSGLGLPSLKGEGAPVGYDVQIAGSKQAWVHDVWALAIRITEEAIEDNLYELNGGGNAEELSEMFHDLGEAMAENVETLMARFFNYGTATTYHTTRFGKALFATDHPRLDGTSFSNLSTATDLTYETFWAVVVAAENQFNYRQHRITKNVKKLWYPPALEPKVLEILKSPTRPDTANRAINAYAESGRGIVPVKWPHISNANNWFLQLDGRGIVFWWRRKTRFARERDFQTGDLMCKADQRFSAEIADERDFYGVIPS